jgi:hypothetical protein
MTQTSNILDLQPADLVGREFTLDDLPTDKGRIEIWEEFKPGKTYVVGADFALGMEGRDYDAAVVMVKGDGKPRQVAELHGHWGETFDRLLYAVLTYYGGAFFLGERQVGLPVMRRLWTDYEYRYLYFERDESKANRPYMDKLGHPRVYDDFTLRNLRRDLITGSYEIRSRTLWDQMRNLQFYAKGEEPGVSDRQRDEALRVRLPGGGSPDLVMALAYAWLAVREVVHYEKPKPKWEKGTLGDLLGHETLEPRIDEGRGATWRKR